MTAVAIAHIDLHDRVTLPTDKRRKKPVQAIENRQPQEQIAPDGLQTATGIGGPVAQDGLADRIRDPAIARA